jgi:nitroimidazol reductase NimA-like FMN-containing flavoprotein (pyridoxamine 5'-phosphate oxidase superfamily)
MSYHFLDGRFYFVTSPNSLHGRLMSRRGRATMTVQFENCDGRSVDQWYVMAEGPAQFTDHDPKPHVRAILTKDRGADNVDEWTAAMPSPDVQVALLEPDRISGYEFHESLDQ